MKRKIRHRPPPPPPASDRRRYCGRCSLMLVLDAERCPACGTPASCEEKATRGKGARFDGTCARTACATAKGATFWNPSTQRWYCAACARKIDAHAPGLMRRCHS